MDSKNTHALQAQASAGTHVDFPKSGYWLFRPHSKDYSILGHMLGSIYTYTYRYIYIYIGGYPYFRELPCETVKDESQACPQVVARKRQSLNKKAAVLCV